MENFVNYGLKIINSLLQYNNKAADKFMKWKILLIIFLKLLSCRRFFKKELCNFIRLQL
jgi:hypothetical protein